MKNPKAGPSPETKCFYCKRNGHWKRNYPKFLADKKDGKVNKGICDIHVIDVYLTSAHSSAWVFVGFWVPADPQGSNSGVHAEITPPAYPCVTFLVWYDLG